MMLKRVQMNLQCFTCDFYCAITNAFVLNVFCVCAVSNKLFGAMDILCSILLAQNFREVQS